MATRLFQPWQKKRGHRRTGSQVAGSVGEGMMFAGMLLVGSFALIALITSRMVDIPGVSSLNTGSGLWLSVIVLSSLILIGAGGAIWTLFQAGTSAERRESITGRANIELRSQLFPDAKKYPSIPRNENLFNSPGVRLSYRLPCSTSPTINLLALAILCLMLNGFLAALAMIAVKGFLAGDPPWIVAVILVPMIYAASKLTWYFLNCLSETVRIGPTSVEVSGLPLYPGQRYDICVSQVGRMSLQSIKVHLACDEHATFREGTDVRNESRRISLQKVLHCVPTEVRPGTPLVHQGEMVMPVGIMHSFQSSSNAVKWKLLVEGKTENGHEFERTFPVVVYPSPSVEGRD